MTPTNSIASNATLIAMNDTATLLLQPQGNVWMKYLIIPSSQLAQMLSPPLWKSRSICFRYFTPNSKPIKVKKFSENTLQTLMPNLCFSTSQPMEIGPQLSRTNQVTSSHKSHQSGPMAINDGGLPLSSLHIERS